MQPPSSSSRLRSSNAIELGPYADNDILDATTIGNPVVLQDVAFEQSGRLIGLDFIDDNSCNDGSATIHGKWAVERKILSASGRRSLTVDLQLRKDGRPLDYFLKHGCSTTLYVKLHGKMAMIPFVRKTKANTGFNFAVGVKSHVLDKCSPTRINTSRAKTYDYTISSLRTEQLLYHSSKFFDRYRTLHLIEKVVWHNKTRIPVSERNPEWILQEYVRLCGREGRSQLPPEEIRQHALDSLLANADWLAQMANEKKGILDKEAWETFASRVKRGQGETTLALGSVAGTDNREGSNAIEVDEDVTSDIQLPNEGLNKTFRTKNVSKEGPPKKRRKEERPKLPSFISQAPVFQSGRPWQCPGRSCTFSIDFRHGLRDEDLDVLTAEERTWIQTTHPNLSDDRFLELLGVIVDGHYHKHLDDLGIGIYLITPKRGMYGEDNGKPKRITRPREIPLHGELRYEWVKPANHKPPFSFLHSDSE